MVFGHRFSVRHGSHGFLLMLCWSFTRGLGFLYRWLLGRRLSLYWSWLLRGWLGFHWSGLSLYWSWLLGGRLSLYWCGLRYHWSGLSFHGNGLRGRFTKIFVRSLFGLFNLDKDFLVACEWMLQALAQLHGEIPSFVPMMSAILGGDEIHINLRFFAIFIE